LTEQDIRNLLSDQTNDIHQLFEDQTKEMRKLFEDQTDEIRKLGFILDDIRKILKAQVSFWVQM
jgi:hypothetical protein